MWRHGAPTSVASCTSSCVRRQMRVEAERLGLVWTSAAEDFLRESNRDGYSYDTHRVAAEQPGRWRERLTADQVAEAIAVLRRFPLHRLFDEVGAPPR